MNVVSNNAVTSIPLNNARGFRGLGSPETVGAAHPFSHVGVYRMDKAQEAFGR